MDYVKTLEAVLASRGLLKTAGSLVSEEDVNKAIDTAKGVGDDLKRLYRDNFDTSYAKDQMLTAGLYGAGLGGGTYLLSRLLDSNANYTPAMMGALAGGLGFRLGLARPLRFSQLA